MSSLDHFAEAFESIKRSHEAGRLAHAHLIVGSPAGEGRAMAEAILRLVLCTGAQRPCGKCGACTGIATREHPDVAWVEPESLSRAILIDDMRGLIRIMSQTSFAGGWKAGVVLEADRMNREASNTFLKTLEEPTRRTILLLVTDSPQGLLPTIVSRCQRILLRTQGIDLAPEVREAVLVVLRRNSGGGVLDGLSSAAGIRALLDAEKEVIEEQESERAEREHVEDDDIIAARSRARYIAYRTSIVRLVEAWHRDVLCCAVGGDPALLQLPGEQDQLRRAAAERGVGGALRGLKAVHDLDRQLDILTPQDTPPLEAFFSAGRA